MVRTINKTVDGRQQSTEFMTKTNSEVQPGKNRNKESSIPPAEPEADYEETPRQRGTTRVSTSTKLPGTKRLTPTVVTLLVDNGASIEEALTRIMDCMGDDRIVDSRAVHVERDSLREEIDRSYPNSPDQNIHRHSRRSHTG